MTISQGPIGASSIASDSGSSGSVIQASLTETFFVTDSTTQGVAVSLRENWIISGSALAPKISVSLSDTFLVTDAVTTNMYQVLRDSFLVADSVTPVATIRVTARSTAVARDAATGYLSERRDISEAFLARGEHTSTTVGVVERETFSVASYLQSSLTSGKSVREKFLASGRALPRRSHTERESFSARGNHSRINLKRILLREEFLARGSEVLTRTGGKVTAREHFKAFGRAQPFSTIRSALSDRFTVYDRMFSPASTEPPASIEATVSLKDTQLWTADMRSWGMSRYVGIPVIDFAGSQYGVGSGGLYTYDPGSVMAFLETGDMPLVENEQVIQSKRRLNYLYVYGTASESLSVRATADVNSQRESYTYADAIRSGSASRAMRIQLGRGFASNYAQFRIGGAVTFDVANLELETTVSGRRI